MNRFHGTIPTFLKCNSLRSLNLYSNQFEGIVSRTLVDCKHLELLDLGSNKITDTFPQSLGTLPELQVLVLKSNRFYGPVHSSFKIKNPFPKLRIFDISNNAFSGLLSANFFKNFKAMKNVHGSRDRLKYMGNLYCQDSMTMVMKGQELELVRILTVFTTIDLSSNKFEGEIPKTIGSLNSLRMLNLSHNSLVGHIPSLLGSLSALESLDLSSNQLEGEIPAQLTDLTFLLVLNLSQNQLVGHIPHGRQFNTFQNDSYNGNLALCGFPLLENCREDRASQSPPSGLKQDNSIFLSGFNWKSMSMGYSCGTVFGIIMRYLMFLTRKPKWFTRIVERKRQRKAKRLKNGNRHNGRRN